MIDKSTFTSLREQIMEEKNILDFAPSDLTSASVSALQHNTIQFNSTFDFTPPTTKQDKQHNWTWNDDCSEG